MAHNDYVMPSGKWVSVPSPEMIARLDRKVAEGINGDEGGTWAPETPIAIGGAGLSVSCGAKLLGGVRTGRGYASSLDGTQPRISLSGTKFPSFNSPRTRTTVVNVGPVADRASMGMVTYDRSGNVISYRDNFGADGLTHRVAIPQMRVHNGATLAAIVFRWRLTERPLSLPPTGVAEAFAIEAFRSDLAGYPTTHKLTLRTDGVASGVQYLGGWASPIYSTLDEFWNGGRVKALTYVPDQNDVIDTGAFTYQAFVRVGYSALVHSIELQFSNINDQRWE